MMAAPAWTIPDEYESYSVAQALIGQVDDIGAPQARDWCCRAVYWAEALVQSVLATRQWHEEQTGRPYDYALELVLYKDVILPSDVSAAERLSMLVEHKDRVGLWLEVRAGYRPRKVKQVQK